MVRRHSWTVRECNETICDMPANQHHCLVESFRQNLSRNEEMESLSRPPGLNLETGQKSFAWVERKEKIYPQRAHQPHLLRFRYSTCMWRIVKTEEDSAVTHDDDDVRQPTAVMSRLFSIALTSRSPHISSLWDLNLVPGVCMTDLGKALSIMYQLTFGRKSLHEGSLARSLHAGQYRSAGASSFSSRRSDLPIRGLVSVSPWSLKYFCTFLPVVTSLNLQWHSCRKSLPPSTSI